MSELVIRNPKSIEPRMIARIPLYAAGLIASAMGLAALNAVLSGGEFTLFALTLITIGYCISWGVRARIISNSTLATIALIILLSTLAALVIEPQVRYQLIPEEALDAPDLLAAIVLASLMVVYSFKLTTDASVLFLCVPSLSLIGLLATAAPTAEMLTYFGIYLACACFVLTRQNALANRESESRGSSVKLHIGITAGITLIALFVGSLIGTMFYPLITKAFMARMSDIDTTQMIGQISEEFVPIATGPVVLSDQELMTVKCDRALLWRERTYNHYTGQGWSTELLPQERNWIYPTRHAAYYKERDNLGAVYTFKIIDPLNPEPRSAVEKVEQTYRITSGVYRTVFAAGEPEFITSDGWPPVVRVSAGLEVSAFSKGYTYRAVSKVSVATPRELRTVSTAYPEVVKARYLGTPQSSWQVQKLTSRITETLSTPFDKAQAIQSYLSVNYAYDTNAPAAPSDRDAVSFFLFESKRGYCDIFASAMVIMARQAGIPARWATGFAPGEYDSSDGAYHVRLMDKHAWAELYFPGYGWIPFDIAADQQATSWFAYLKEYWRMFASERGSLFAVAVILFLIAYLVMAEVVPRIGRNAEKPAWQRTASMTEIGECYQRMCRTLARYGYPRYPAVTPLEYAGKLKSEIRNSKSEKNAKSEIGDLLQTLDFLTADFVEFRYSGREPAPEKIGDMKSNLHVLTRELKSAKKGKLFPKRQHS